MLNNLLHWENTSLIGGRVTPAAAFVGLLTVILMAKFAVSKRSTSRKNPQTYHLPYTLRNWPWESIIGPYYAAAQAESVAWLESFHPFTPKAQISFNKADFSAIIPTRSSKHLLTSPTAGLMCALTFTKADHCKSILALIAVRFQLTNIR